MTWFDRATLIGAGTAFAGLVMLALSHKAASYDIGSIWGVPVSSLFRELSSAVVIAGVLAMTLEKVLLRRLTEDVRSGVEAYYLTYGLPKEFGDEVIYVRDVKIVRKDYTVRVRIWNHETDPDKVHVEFRVSYTVINFSNAEIEYVQNMQIEEVGADTAKVVQISRSGSDLSDEDVLTIPGANVQNAVRVKPNAKDPHNTFDYVVKKVFAKAYGSDALIMTLPAVNVRIFLEDKPDDLEVDVIVGHRAHSDVQMTPANDPRMWRLDKAFFPGAAIFFEWKKKPPAEKAQLGAIPEAVIANSR